MKRLLAYTLVASFASSSMVFAGESLVQSATRLSQEAGRAQATAATVKKTNSMSTQAPTLLSRIESKNETLLGQDQAVLSKSGMGRGKKVLIYAAIGVGFAASAYEIDHHVLNVTPSSLGTRKD
jgi:hypothetical protein